jgi:tetratricopeptide (TPR) repeat protein
MWSTPAAALRTKETYFLSHCHVILMQFRHWQLTCMMIRACVRGFSFLLVGALAASSDAQTRPATPAAGDAASQGISLAKTGRCRAALPFLRKGATAAAATGPQAKDAQYQAALAFFRCAMSLNNEQSTSDALLLLRRDFGSAPEVLYLTAHYYSDLASGAEKQLSAQFPESPQARKLDAEALESQEKWDEAAALYKKILDQNAREPGIHYRLARIWLSRAETASNAAEAKRELEAELKLDPSNGSAEFMLGELSRRAGEWDTAIQHFSSAARLDEGFAEAYLALGTTLCSAEKYSDAIAPLERYIKMQPEDPAGHYQLGTAYARTGNKQAAQKELTLQRELAAKAPAGSESAH